MAQVCSLKVKMDDVTDAESGRKLGRGPVWKTEWKEWESSACSVLRLQPKTDCKGYTWEARDDSLTKYMKTWTYPPQMCLLLFLLPCNWTWRKDAFSIGWFRKRIWGMLKCFKIWWTIPCSPSGRSFKEGTGAILHSTRARCLILMNEVNSTSDSAVIQAAIRAFGVIVVFNNWRNEIRLSNYCCGFPTP